MNRFITSSFSPVAGLMAPLTTTKLHIVLMGNGTLASLNTIAWLIAFLVSVYPPYAVGFNYIHIFNSKCQGP